MAALTEWATSLILFLVAFVPPILYLVWVRRFERYHREPWSNLLKAFAWGAIGAVILAVLLEVLLLGGLVFEPTAAGQILSPAILGAVIIAPIVEEFSKGLGLGWLHDGHPEAEDGFVYGAAVGLGFAATENLLYISEAFLFQGFAVAAATAILRIVASALLHAGASAILGYGVWRARFGTAGAGLVLGTYLLAVLVHAAFNLLASVALLVTLLAAIVLAIGFFLYVRKRIHNLDRDGRRMLGQNAGDTG